MRCEKDYQSGAYLHSASVRIRVRAPPRNGRQASQEASTAPSANSARVRAPIVVRKNERLPCASVDQCGQGGIGRYANRPLTQTLSVAAPE
jgi:hypothetical protein